MHIRTHGERGPLVCLIHGWGLSGAVWTQLLPRLAGRLRVVVPDLPGHGRSADGGDLGLDAVAAALARALPGPAVVVGWSLGALFAIRLAASIPGRVRALGLVAGTPRFCAGPGWPRGMDPMLLARFAEDLAADAQSTVGRFLALQVRGAEGAGDTLRRLKGALREHGEARPEALSAGLALLAGADLRAELAALRAPVGVLLGGRDRLVSPGLERDLRGLRGDAAVRVLDGAGHAPFLSHPRAFEDWLDGLTA